MPDKLTRDKIISGDIKIQSRGVTEEEVKFLSKVPYSRKDLIRQFKIGTGQLPPREEDESKS